MANSDSGGDYGSGSGSSDDAMTATTGTVCHALPCSVNEDMVAPIGRYFYPTPLSATTESNRLRTENEKEEHDEQPAVVAAQFRGRGLLCAVNNRDRNQDSSSSSAMTSPSFTTSLPSDVAGVVLTSKSIGAAAATNDEYTGSERGQELQVAESFRHLYEWRHEHDPSKVTRALGGDGLYHRKSSKGGLEAAIEWCQLARAVHEPIEVPTS